MDFSNSDLRFMRAQGQLSCELDGEIALLNLDSKLYFGLTDVAATIWRELEAPKDFEAIVAAVIAEYEVDAEQCRQDLGEFLGHLQERGLLEVEDQRD